MIFNVICNIFHKIDYQTAHTASLGFYFEKTIHAELLWQRGQRALLIKEVERWSQVNWSYLLVKWKAYQSHGPSDDNIMYCNIWTVQFHDIKLCISPKPIREGGRKSENMTKGHMNQTFITLSVNISAWVTHKDGGCLTMKLTNPMIPLCFMTEYRFWQRDLECQKWHILHLKCEMLQCSIAVM